MILPRLRLRSDRARQVCQPSRLIVWSTIATTVAAFTIPFVEGLGPIFGFVPLSVLELACVVAIVLGYILTTELAKAWFFRSEQRPF